MGEEVAVHGDRLGVTPEAMGGNVRERSYSDTIDPLACYCYGVGGHLARDCPQAAQSQGSVNAGPSRGPFSKSGRQGPKNRVRGRRVRFGGLNVLYNEEGIAYPVDDAGQLYVPSRLRTGCR